MLSLVALSLVVAQDPATLTGRLVHADGAPVAHAAVELFAAPADPELAATWSPPAIATDAEGRLRARFVPPGVPVACRVALPGGDALTHTWHAVAPGAAIELGEVRLPATTTVAGRVVLSTGDVLTDGWTVVLDLESRLESGPRLRTVRAGAPSAESGEFRFEAVPALPFRLTASHPLGVRATTTVAHVGAGGETFVELEHAGVDPSGVLVVQLDCLADVPLSRDSVVLEGPDGAELRCEVLTDPMSVRFEGLVEPRYVLHVRDPALLPLSTHVEPGCRQPLHVEGSAWVAFQVTDGRDGERLRQYRVRAWPGTRAGLGGATLRVHGQGLQVWEPVPPVPLTFEVRPDRRPPVRVHVDDLAPREQRRLEVVVPGVLPVRGRVREADGAPAVGARVRWDDGEDRGGETTTDELGRYTFDADGWPLTVTASRGPLVRAEATLEAGAAPRVDLTLPPWTRLTGRVRLPADVSLAQLRLDARLGELRAPLEVAADGTFVLQAAPLQSILVGGRGVRPRTRGAHLDLDLRGRVLRRVVRFTDGDGRVWAGRRVRWSQLSAGLGLVGGATTDDQGRLSLALLPGLVHLRGVSEEAHPVPLAWSEALPAEVPVSLAERLP